MTAERPAPIVFSPNLRAGDALAAYWLRQATLRARREIAWLWHERGIAPAPGQLPPPVDRASESLDLSRHWAEKQGFFAGDPAAVYLTEQLEAPPPAPSSTRGTFGWVVGELALDDVSAFTLALALASAFDGSFGAVIAACLNDPSRVSPTLMLVQRLWDQPEAALAVADPMHPLFAYGVLRRAPGRPGETIWDEPLSIAPLVARALIGTGDTTPAGLQAARSDEHGELTETQRLIACRLGAEPAAGVRVVPLVGAPRSPYRQTAIDLARAAGLDLWEFRGSPALLAGDDYLATLLTLSWLRGRALFVGHDLFERAEPQRGPHAGLPLTAVPVTILLPVADRRSVSHLDPRLLLPFVEIPRLTFEGRLAAWRDGLGTTADDYADVVTEAARRFRYEREVVLDICRGLKALPPPFRAEDVTAACRAATSVEIGELATRVQPRFAGERLILPKKQALQFEELIAGMQALTRVHYDWGTARVWNEAGITLLFAGPPGTGKTMAAEIMALRLDLPMYRIDLSQVVNKYIGETEKNLKRVFDAADATDLVLFFDEADALFGRRLEASDARDRYANLEISYLLERMERFKGLAILATNRKDDLDQAFLRRIRHVIDFPVPGEAERAAIWRQSIPAAVAEHSRVDVPFLARQFPLSGGYIRSIVFNACLQSARRSGGARELKMQDVMIAVKREYDKLNRSLSPEQLGPYAAAIAALE